MSYGTSELGSTELGGVNTENLVVVAGTLIKRYLTFYVEQIENNIFHLELIKDENFYVEQIENNIFHLD